MNLSVKEPSYGTILTWAKKVGFFELEIKKERNDDWVIIIDESVEFGHDKLLVIYGVSVAKTSFESALNYKDLTPLSIISSDKWTGEMIEAEIKKIEGEYGKIIYAVADGGNAIKKALRLAKITHVYDITHKLAWFLKETYKEDDAFQSYVTKMSKMRGALALSAVSHILPPNQRIHSRFMNLDVISDWGLKVLNYLNQGNESERTYKELDWVREYQELILELSEVNRILSETKTLLKTKGISLKNLKTVENIFHNVKIKNKRTNRLTGRIHEFFREIIDGLPEMEKIICSSDIIESAFGKYKNYISNNPMVGITDLSILMASFTSSLSVEQVKAAMETVKNKDLKTWRQDNIGETNLQKRKRVLRKMG